jgi:hypothetical protein
MALMNDPIASESAERLLVVDLHDGKDAAMSGPDDSSVAHVDRRLAAILSADVKEYSRLMGADDVGTVDMLTTYRTAMSALISEYRGRVVDSEPIVRTDSSTRSRTGSSLDASPASLELATPITPLGDPRWNRLALPRHLPYLARAVGSGTVPRP